MSEQLGMGAAVQQDNPSEGAYAGVSAGEILRHARESAGVHIAALAVALKVPVSKIEALETGRYDEFPDNVFMRALAASVCRTLKVDSAQVLALLPSGSPQALNVTRGLNASFKDPSGRFKAEGTLDRPNKSRWVGVAVVVLLLGALAVAFFPHKDSSMSADAPLAALNGNNAVSQGAAGGAAAPSEPREAAPVVEPAASEPVTAVTSAVTPAVGATAAATATVPVAAANTASAPAAAASTPLPVAGDSSRILEVRAREPSWIKIVSAVNGVVLQRELTAGESVIAAGSPPWNLTIGRPDATEVIVRGQPISMSNYPRGSVARFEVK